MIKEIAVHRRKGSLGGGFCKRVKVALSTPESKRILGNRKFNTLAIYLLEQISSLLLHVLQHGSFHRQKCSL